MKKESAILKKIIVAIIVVAVLLITVFVVGRYGWKLFGFSVSESAGIESVEVTDRKVRITGFYPGSFPRGFLGYHAEQVDNTLYVGFKFSALFGIFETTVFWASANCVFLAARYFAKAAEEKDAEEK